ncbi:hypothetical protein [Pseudomonas sp. P9_31]|uniref:hypothetical protein n=1 Tax=Pseudomonas sp. P9_31 TaxID=3043448 RepID=UPI002A3627D8|nr:hypothetical protein [Pseudomonas sp. P9_31]WPN59746.1 hypothetical protein QMK51_09130 [Pseudomonas sp. P9_31]
MTHNQQAVDAADVVAVCAASLEKLRAIESMLATELPAAQAALAGAEKRLRAITHPTKAATRKAELEALHRRLNEVKENA